jgi:hypothetical protein
MTPQLERAIRKFINTVRENPKFKADALEFLAAVENEFNGLEAEIDTFHQTISTLIADERLYLDILQMYGVNLNKLGVIPITTLKDEIEWAKTSGYIHIPERLIPYVEQIEPETVSNYQWI